MLPDCKGDRIVGKARKHVRYYEKSTGGGNYNAMHENSLYKVECTDVTTEKLEANIIAENILSQVDSEGNHYQVLTEVTDQERDDISIAKVDGFIKSIVGT